MSSSLGHIQGAFLSMLWLQSECPHIIIDDSKQRIIIFILLQACESTGVLGVEDIQCAFFGVIWLESEPFAIKIDDSPEGRRSVLMVAHANLATVVFVLPTF